MSHTYSIKTENKENPRGSVITKTNVEVDFTVDELLANRREFTKMAKQLKAQKELADAKMKNIEEHHPFVMDLSEEQAFTVHMYQEARAMSRVCGQKLPEYESELAFIEEELKEIEAQTGIKAEDPKPADAPQGEQAAQAPQPGAIPSPFAPGSESK